MIYRFFSIYEPDVRGICEHKPNPIVFALMIALVCQVSMMLTSIHINSLYIFLIQFSETEYHLFHGMNW